MVGRIIRPLQGGQKRQFVCRSMAFEHQTLQAKQSRAIVAAMVNQLFKAR